MFKWVDRSSVLSKLLEKISTAMTRRRGLPVIVGIVCVIISFIAQGVNVFAENTVLELVGVIALHAGLLLALLGLLLAEALGS